MKKTFVWMTSKKFVLILCEWLLQPFLFFYKGLFVLLSAHLHVWMFSIWYCHRFVWFFCWGFIDGLYVFTSFYRATNICRVCWGFIDGLYVFTSFLLRFYFVLQSNEYLQSVAECLQWVMRVDCYRMPFVQADGINRWLSSTLVLIQFFV